MENDQFVEGMNDAKIVVACVVLVFVGMSFLEKKFYDCIIRDDDIDGTILGKIEFIFLMEDLDMILYLPPLALVCLFCFGK